jgi:hypothetical protein
MCKIFDAYQRCHLSHRYKKEDAFSAGYRTLSQMKLQKFHKKGITLEMKNQIKILVESQFI